MVGLLEEALELRGSIFHVLFCSVDILIEVLHSLILALDDDIEVLCFLPNGLDDAQKPLKLIVLLIKFSML